MADKLSYPAGVNRIENRLYVGDAVLNKLHVYEIRNDGLELAGEISKLKGNDNIRTYGGQLLTPCHVKPLKFIGHAKDPQKKSPVEVFLVDPKSGKITSLYDTDGSTISGGSAAIIYDKYLYISQIFEPYILKLEMEP